MPKHVVSGVDKATSRDREMLIEASSDANARAKAELRGLIVTRVIVVPEPPAQPAAALLPAPAPALAPAPAPSNRGGVQIPLLVSAISNVVVGFMWASSIFGIVLAIPMWILCVFEFILWSKSDQLSAEAYANRAKTLGIFELVIGLANLPTLICGILVLIGSGKVRRETSSSAISDPAEPAGNGGPSMGAGAPDDVGPDDILPMETRLMALLGYFGLLVIIPLLSSKGSRFVRFHCNQGLVLTLAMSVWACGCLLFFVGLLFVSALLEGTSVATVASAGATTQQQVSSQMIANVGGLGAGVLQSCSGLIAGGILCAGLAGLSILELLGIIQALTGETKPLPLARRFRLIRQS